MTSINLIYNRGFCWQTKGDSYAKGFAHAPGGRLLAGQDLAAYFEACSGLEDFSLKAAGANGMFAVVLARGKKVWMAADRMRTFPLFYAIREAGDGSGIPVSDSVDRIIDLLGGWSLNPNAATEFLATGYVPGHETLAEGIFQVQAGEVIEIDFHAGGEVHGAKISAAFYSSYRSAGVSGGSIQKLTSELDGIAGRVFGRLVRSLDGRTAVLALSGGYDSRFVAAMLKKMEYPDVMCFSYGRKGNKDMLRAEEVALKLGFKFIPVEYSDEMIRDYLVDGEFYDYVKFSSGWTSMFFMQEYFALRHLRENALIPEDAVFIPGHSGDFFAGSQLIRHGLHGGQEARRRTVRRIFDVKYAWYRPVGEERKTMLGRIEKNLREKDIIHDALPYTIHEDWDLREKLAKFIVNSCNVYAWYGYEYRLPLYDYELQDFFRDVPFDLKANKRLYDDYLRQNVFSSFDLNFPGELQPDKKAQQMAMLKGKVKKTLPASIMPSTLSSRDPIFYYEITRMLRQDLARKGIPVRIRGNSYNSLIVRWYIEYLKAGMPGP